MEFDSTVTKRAVVQKKESVLKIAFNFIFEFAELTSIHGFRHLTSYRRHFIEYFLWASVLSMSLTGTLYLSSQSWRRFAYDPTVIAIERDFKNWNTSLPSGVLCPGSKYSEEKLEAFLDRRFPDGDDETRNVTKDFLIELAKVDYETLTHNNVNFDLLDGVAAKIKTEEYMDILYNISFHMTRDDDVNSTRWDLDYNMTVTERGYCYGFNSFICAYNHPVFFFLAMNVAYKPKGKTHVMQGKAIGGHLQYSVKQINDAVTVSFVANNDVPDIGTKAQLTNKGDFSFFDFNAQSTRSSDEVRELTVQQRSCRFLDESNLEISRAYSFNWCRMNCRWLLALKLCGCVPHFYKKSIRKVPICDRVGLKCIQKHALILIELRNLTTQEKVKCKCLPVCEDTMYVAEEIQEIQWYNSTNVQWTLKGFPKIRYRRELIFGFTDLLISIGGLAGLFLGCSVLSFTEIIYFFTMQLYNRLYKHFKKEKTTVLIVQG